MERSRIVHVYLSIALLYRLIQRTAHSPHFSSPTPVAVRYLRRRNTRRRRDSDNESGGHKDHSEISQKEQDRFLPIANVSRIMKKALPANAKISKDAKETVQECVSEFISFITGEASDKCQREKRKTINGDDLLWAMTTLGFEDYVEPLKIYLHKFRDTEGEKSAMAGRGEKEGGDGNGGAVNIGNSTGGYEGMYGMNIMAHQGGPVYGYGQMAGGSGKVGSGYHIGPGSGGTGGRAR